MNNLNHITNLKQLLRVTIDDVKLVKKDDRYDFNVIWWHKLNVSEGCAVCLGGSIMAKTLGVDIGIDILPSDFDKRTEALLLLIDQLRAGYGAISARNSLKTKGVEFDLNNLSELDIDNYDLLRGDIEEWEKLYNDLV